MKTFRLVGGGIALVVFLLVMVPPFLKEAKSKAARDAAWAPVAASLQPVVDEYLQADLRSLKSGQVDSLGGRKAVVVDLGAKKLWAGQADLDPAPKSGDEVGLVVLYKEVRDAKPSYEFEGGGKTYGNTVVMVAIAHPEKKLVGTTKKHYDAPKSTVGLKVAGMTATSLDMPALIPPSDVQHFVDGVVAKN